jgi:GntR family transcriptional regulator
MLEKYRNRPRDEAAEFIEAYIIENKLTAHEKLPSERKFCQFRGFNRITLRSAIKKLELEGILYRRHGAGTFVAPPKLLRNLQNMESFHSMAERAQKTLQTTQLYNRVLPCTKAIAKKLNIPPVSPIFILQRLRLMNGVPLMLETTHVNYALCQGIEKYDFAHESLFQILEKKFGIKADHGIEHLNITYAGLEEAALLEIPANRAVFFIEGISDTSDGRHIEYFESVVRSDQVQFISILKRP